MNKNLRLLIVLFVLLSASLACKTLTGGSPPTDSQPTEAPAQPTAVKDTPAKDTPATATPVPEAPQESTATPEAQGDEQGKFPMPADATNITDMGSDMLNFQTKMGIKDVIAFYRDAFGKEGYKERQILTTITDAVFSIVFDGHPSGKAIVVQGVDMGNGTVNVNITLQDT